MTKFPPTVAISTTEYPRAASAKTSSNEGERLPCTTQSTLVTVAVNSRRNLPLLSKHSPYLPYGTIIL